MAAPGSPLPHSVAAAANKISAFFHSLLLLLLDALHRVVKRISGSTKQPTKPRTSASTHLDYQTKPSLDDMSGPAPQPARRPPVKIVPALPLRPPRATPRKENVPPQNSHEAEPGSAARSLASVAPIVPSVAHLGLTDDVPGGPLRTSTGPSKATVADAAIHNGFMREALDMARLALRTNETPVGCVLVHKDRVIAKGMNATNVTRNGTRHAELMALSALLSYSPSSDAKPKAPASRTKQPLSDATNMTSLQQESSDSWGDVDPEDGHLYPYGQKLHPAPRVDRSVITESVLYVTVEPCVMCASLLRQLGIKKVYFGAVNDKFGGTGGVFRIHVNSSPVSSTAESRSSPVSPNGDPALRPSTGRRPASSSADTSAGNDNQQLSGLEAGTILGEPTMEGDGGNVERGFEAEGGWGRDEAVTLLRQFYVQENGRAPVPRKKEGRAARLAAMLERDGHAGGPMADAPPIPGSEEKSALLSNSSSEYRKHGPRMGQLIIAGPALIAFLTAAGRVV